MVYTLGQAIGSRAKRNANIIDWYFFPFGGGKHFVVICHEQFNKSVRVLFKICPVKFQNDNLSEMFPKYFFPLVSLIAAAFTFTDWPGLRQYYQERNIPRSKSSLGFYTVCPVKFGLWDNLTKYFVMILEIQNWIRH